MKPTRKVKGSNSLETEMGSEGPSEEAQMIVRAAKESGVTLRLIGGFAIRFHCHGKHSAHLRAYNDIDLFGLSKESERISLVFRKLGYSPNAEYNFLYGQTRLQFIDEKRQKSVDVFLDKFRMGHTLDFRRRLSLDDLTIPITDLLLTKLQVVQLSAKDVKDIIAIVEDHEITHNEGSEILNVDRIADQCSKDWGLYKTIAQDLEKVDQLIREEEFGVVDDQELVLKLNTIHDSIMNRKKSLRWTLRALIGTRVRWYREVEEGQAEVF